MAPATLPNHSIWRVVSHEQAQPRTSPEAWARYPLPRSITMTRANHILMARIYLREAHHTPHRDWAFTLLRWAANRRMQAAWAAHQKELFS